MIPSREAQGHSSTISAPASSMADSATMAPASTWSARSLDTPGSSERSAGVISASFSTHSPRSLRSSRRWTYGPSLEGAAPVIRPSDRNVFDVATQRSNGPRRNRSPTTAPIWARA